MTIPNAPTPDLPALLSVLTRDRLVEIGRALGVSVPASARKERQVEVLLGSGQLGFGPLLSALHRDELKAACRGLGLDDAERSRPVLAARLLQARGELAEPPASIFDAGTETRELPRAGDVVRVRHRQYLVEAVTPPAEPWLQRGPVAAHRVRMVGLDDDNQGRLLEVLWELELGARVLPLESHGLGRPERLDPPRRFGAYLATVRWHGVTATDSRLFQAPFRAGLQLMNHQLVPLERALELPRANLFIADDVGLGKTIEAGLVLQELRLRQRVDFVLVACPAAICLQWRDELWKRFGLHFEVMSRDFVARRRQERGFAVNPWATHARFIVSHGLLRRPEYREPLLRHLGERARKSLLILDEAHVAAPATASRYAVDSRITHVIRDVAPRFENRLFLSATPHNGHSNSFSALLELLDPQRFTRGVPVAATQRDRVMVRRLKSDLQALGTESFPRRHVVRIELEHQDGRWTAAAHDSLAPDAPPERRALGDAEPFELVLAEKLAAYTELVKTPRRSGRVVLIRLQQRLLSSVEAFCRTLRLHAEHVDVERGGVERSGTSTLPFEDIDDDSHGLDDDELEARDAAQVAALSRRLEAPSETARRLLAEMLDLAERHRDAADAKARALLGWIREHQCPAAGLGGKPTPAERRWSERRVIVFTEFGDTLRHLERLLGAAFEGTERGGERVMSFRGGMSDARREDVQRAFNGPPDEHPVRVLLATDAAREGVNLQGWCADLFHYDVPWNPARLEQRNGRIDRTLQSSPDVRCHYFVYPQRPEDRVLDALVRKVDVIRREVGSLGTVLFDQIENVLAGGIDSTTAERIERAETAGGRRETAREELESQRQLRVLGRQIDRAGSILNRSRELAGFRPELLRRTLDEALALTGAGALTSAAEGSFQLPELPDSWQPTLDTLRPRRERDEPFWEWRKRPPLPVVFEPPTRLREDRVHLHLEHPLVKRLLGRFLAQGFSAHDLARVSALRDPENALVHAVLFGRLSLFGPGAARLHDQLVTVAAPVFEPGEPGHLEPLDEAAERRLVDRLWRLLEAADAEGAPEAVHRRLLAQTEEVFPALWAHLRTEADSLAHQAEDRLGARGRQEAAELRELLESQRKALEREVARQLSFEFTETERDQRRQWENDRRHMAERLERIDREIEAEPPQLEALYRVTLRRLEPVGLVYLWPASR